MLVQFLERDSNLPLWARKKIIPVCNVTGTLVVHCSITEQQRILKYHVSYADLSNLGKGFFSFFFYYVLQVCLDSSA